MYGMMWGWNAAQPINRRWWRKAMGYATLHPSYCFEADYLIVGVPTYDDLHETAVGWLNLAWEIAIREVSEFQEAGCLFDEMEEVHGAEYAEAEEQKYWKKARYKLNNSISLIQQSLEIELKARIARVSPYLLIAGDPNSWPKPDKAGQVDFSDFRTLDSLHLCRVCDLVADQPLSPQFSQRYTELRKIRNKIAHLNAINFKARSSGILVTILMAHGYLYEKGTWMDFRRKYMLTEAKNGPLFDGTDEDMNDRLNYEFAALLWELEPRDLREFFGYDSRKRALTCFNCMDHRTSWCDRHWEAAQRQKSGTVRCVVCSREYTQAEYKKLEDVADKELEDQKQNMAPPTITD